MENIQDILAKLKEKYINKLIDGKCSICGADLKVLPGEKEILCDSCTAEKQEYKRRLKVLEYILPPGLREMSFDNFRDRNDVTNIKTAIDTAKSFVYDDIGFYLYGQSGQGKTHLMTAALKECVMQGKSVKLLRYSVELQNYKDIRVKKADFCEEYAKCKYLFIDDFGSIGSKDDAIDILYGILQRRIENNTGKKIFITANIPITAIDDDRVKSRIVGCCTGYKYHDNGVDGEKYQHIIELGGTDIRLQGLI